MGKSWSDKAAIAMVRRIRGTGRGRRLLDAILEDDANVDWFAHRLGIRSSRTAPPIDQLARGQATEGFEDLMWLFTPTYAWRGVSELLLDEAVYLYRLAAVRPGMRVAELGRYLGGTTYFLAAAGAQVSSFDNDSQESSLARRGHQGEPYRAPLERALAESGLSGRADLITADVLAYDPGVDQFDLIYLDLPLPAEVIRTAFDRWWPSLAPGGRFVLRDGREVRNPGARQFADELQAEGVHQFEAHPPGRYVIVSK